MRSDARIRLEGKLETLEAAIVPWERAARVMRGTAWRPEVGLRFLDTRSATLRPALAQARQMPELHALVARFDRARERVRVGALARLTELGVAPGADDLDSVLATLRDELPIAHQGSLGGIPATHPAVALAFFLGLGAFIAWHKVEALPALLPLLIAFVLHRLAVKKVIVTHRRLVLGRDSAMLRDVTQVTVRVALMTNRRGKKCELEVHTRNRVFEAWSREKPKELLASLEAAGVPCEVERGPLFFWW